MEETVREILYETRHHASRPYTPNYPPQPANENGKRSFFSRGISQLKEKLSGYRASKKLKRPASLFVSPSGERVAVASGNYITVLKKDDDYQKPCGTFTSSNLSSVVYGTWSESHDVLGVIDESNTVYFIKANGDEITRVTMRDIKSSSPIIGIMPQDDADAQTSCLCSFIVLTSDGLLHSIETSRDPNASISSTYNSTGVSTSKNQFPQSVSCFDYHPDLSLFAFVGNSDNLVTTGENFGDCHLSLWRKTRNLNLEYLSSTHFKGIYMEPKSYTGQITYPKVLISPQGSFVATVDLIGCLYIFKLDKEQWSLLSSVGRCASDSQEPNSLSNKLGKSTSDIIDFTWWSDGVLTLAKRDGGVTMFDIDWSSKVMENDTTYSMAILERAGQLEGENFLLESTISDGGYTSFNTKDTKDSHNVEQLTGEGYNQLNTAKLQWQLVSYSAKSVPEMYNNLIGKQRYQAALDFASNHGLDKDEVFKSQWLLSGQGINEINMYLSKIKDHVFVLSECVEKVGSTEDAVKVLLAFGLRLTERYRFSESDPESNQAWNVRMKRLQLLQFRDRLETYLGINMGRFSVQEYRKFRVLPIYEAGVVLAESGKIGALNLLFKRHPYSLSPSMLNILASIPETVPVQSYSQLLPGRSPPANIAMRERDWVECEKMATFIRKLPENDKITQIRTEAIVNLCSGLFWPSIENLSVWYKNRARDIDSFSGQIDNCLSLIDFACRKGIHELQEYHENISYLHHLIYCSEIDGKTHSVLSLAEWDKLSEFEKFRIMLRDVKEDNVLERLHDKAIPFMRSKLGGTKWGMNQLRNDHFSSEFKRADSFLVMWLKEITSENKLDICLIVMEEGCRDFGGNGLFRNELEAVDCALECIYCCTAVDKWSTMATILSMLPYMQGTEIHMEGIMKRRKEAEGHVEAGRLLSYYQVPKPVKFFLEDHSDGKGVKQILRLILSKFIRRQPGRTDNDWASLWRDIQCLREKAFNFLDVEYLLMEFCRGLMKAGRFSLARNYLKGSGSVSMPSDKAENLVIQAAREYFFSASSLACSEIWKAKECLKLIPSSRNVKAEADIIDAITVRLPNLGVTVLPMQFRQIKDPMEIIKMAITTQPGAYLHVEEIIEIAKLLGLTSPDEISAVEEAISREAAVIGDLQLAFDLCLLLAKKGHGQIWDLCAAIARGPALENMSVRSRKQLLGFALSHSDEESISELLHAWKDLDMLDQCEMLAMSTGSEYPEALPENFSEDVSSFKGPGDDGDVGYANIETLLSYVAKDLHVDKGTSWKSFLQENGKFYSFAASKLPWLLELSKNPEHGKKLIPGKHSVCVKTQAIVTMLSWLARNGLAPKDTLVASLAKSIMEPPVSEEEDIMGCSFLLNLMDAFSGVEIIEEQLKTRHDYRDTCSIMNVGMLYSSLHNCGSECEAPSERRELLLRVFKEKHVPLSSDEIHKIGNVQSAFWTDWKLKLKEQKRIADHSRLLKQFLPGVNVSRFMSEDKNYIEGVVFSLIESMKLEKKRILGEVLRLADTYGLNRIKVLQLYLVSVLVSETWTNDDITAEISDVREEIFACGEQTCKSVIMTIYPSLDGSNKERIAYVYGLLSELCLQSNYLQEITSTVNPDPHISSLGLAQYYQVLEKECQRVSFIMNLNFKNVAGLSGLNLKCFRSEIIKHIDDVNLEALAKMVDNLAGIYYGLGTDDLLSSRDVYKFHVLKLLNEVENNAAKKINFESHEHFMGFLSQVEQIYDSSKVYTRILACSDAVGILKRYLSITVPIHGSLDSLPDTSTWQDCLVVLLNFWTRLTDDMLEIASKDSSGEEVKSNSECLTVCLKVFLRLVTEDTVSPSQGWGTVLRYINHGLTSDFTLEIFILCRAMVFSGCGFGSILEVYSEGMLLCPSLTTYPKGKIEALQDLPHLYLNILEPILQELADESHQPQDLYHLLSSLSKLEGNLEDLEKVRLAVWEGLAKFSDDLQLQSHVRVYALELMQFISDRSIKGFSVEIQTNVLPWEGWDRPQYTSKIRDAPTSHGAFNQTNSSTRFTNNLVALRSNQLVAFISSDIEVTSNDLLNVDAAVSCFKKMCDAALTNPQVDTLVAVLEEWDGLFVNMGTADQASPEPSSAENDWNNDDWDEGWESFQDEEPNKDEKEKDKTSDIHPLHMCWFEILKKYIEASRHQDVLEVIDKSSKSNKILLDEDDARSLSLILLSADCFMALKIALLLPHEAIQLQCLDAVEDKLKQEGTSDTVGEDQELLVIMLASGMTSTIINKASYGTTFSYLCYLIGKFSRQCQETELSMLKDKGQASNDRETELLLLFRTVLFPCFVAELVNAGQHILAGFLVTKFMHTNAALSLINIAEASLHRYLEGQLKLLQKDDKPTHGESECHGVLQNTIFGLRSKMENLIRSALSSLPANVR